jgi:hypothetical protein
MVSIKNKAYRKSAIKQGVATLYIPMQGFDLKMEIHSSSYLPGVKFERAGKK